MSTKVLLCGVGGQGTILAAHVLAEVAMKSRLDVKISEIHGMAQRGGSVTTVVTFGDYVESMVCGAGEADIVVSFDLLEALRNIDKLKTDGTQIVNDAVIKPASVLTGKMELPANAQQDLEKAGAILVPAEDFAREAGNSKTQNIVMLGALSAALPFEDDIWVDAISSSVPPKTVDVNIAAFRIGRAFAAERA